MRFPFAAIALVVAGCAPSEGEIRQEFADYVRLSRGWDPGVNNEKSSVTTPEMPVRCQRRSA